MTFRSPTGAEDLLPERAAAFRRIEAAVRDVCERFGYREIRTPIFEYTELFERGVGETTDIVEKEMFTIPPRSEDGEASLSLRPEMTAPTARALIEHNLHKARPFNKLYYIGPAFRRERPQKGRLRQFSQFGVEAFGSDDPRLDAETIQVLAEVLRAAGVKRTEIRLNSIGCGVCRAAYRDALKARVKADLAAYCPNCAKRFERNPFRIFDCKQEKCRAISANLPPIADALCEACRGHFAEVRRSLQAAGLDHTLDGRLVRGLDYYTKTVYEFTSDDLGAQNAVGGGGRYDGLVAELGGPAMGAVGFAAGIERIALLLGDGAAAPAACDFYVVVIRPEDRGEAFKLASRLRTEGFAGDLDYEGKSVKAQMRSANAAGARHVVVLGPDEWARGEVKVKAMATGAETAVKAEALVAALRGRSA